MTHVSLAHLTKQYSNSETTRLKISSRKPQDRPLAVGDVTLSIPAGKLTALLGPSGCGKTTILKMIAGLISPTSGDICFDGQSILSVVAEQRGAVMVFQNHLLFPHLSVGENVAFGLKMRGEDRRETQRKVSQMLELVQLGGYEDRKPASLSGGQQQRVALARALVVEPRVLLLDEPLSNLDACLRDEMRELIHSLQREKRITTVVVTHDQEEAVMLADQLAVIFNGVLQQADTPRRFYDQPANLEVARFFGANNSLTGTVHDSMIQTELGNFCVKNVPLKSGPVHLAIRPENINIASDRHSIGLGLGENTVDGIVQSCMFTGIRSRMKVRVCGYAFEVITDAGAAGQFQEGDRLRLYLPPEKLWAFAN